MPKTQEYFFFKDLRSSDNFFQGPEDRMKTVKAL